MSCSSLWHILEAADLKPHRSVYGLNSVLWNLGKTRASPDFVAPLAHVVQQLPTMNRYDWVVDNLNTHWRLDLCRLVAQGCTVPSILKALDRDVFVVEAERI
jgi:hypothetical protein